MTIMKIRWYHKTSKCEGDDQDRKHKTHKSGGDNKYRECSMGYFYFLPFHLSLFIQATASLVLVLFPFDFRASALTFPPSHCSPQSPWCVKRSMSCASGSTAKAKGAAGDGTASSSIQTILSKEKTSNISHIQQKASNNASLAKPTTQPPHYQPQQHHSIL